MHTKKTALLELTERVNSSLDCGQYALAVFLDIEGAFDKPTFANVEQALIERGINSTSVGWMIALLKNRYTTAEVVGEKKTVKAERGFAQGGGMSTTKWNLVADSLLRRLYSKGIFTIGFADDLCIVIRGRDLSTISDQMRKALKIVEDWCGHGKQRYLTLGYLSFSAPN